MPKSVSLGSRIRKEYVPGLDVVVDDVPLVGVGEARDDVCPDPRERCLQERPLVVKAPLRFPARHVLHDDVRDCAAVELRLAHVVDPHYVRAGEPGGGAASSWKRGNLRVFKFGFKDFHGDGPVQDFVAAEEDAGHTAAGAELPHESPSRLTALPKPLLEVK
jgi:hypothetical protein